MPRGPSTGPPKEVQSLRAVDVNTGDAGGEAALERACLEDLDRDRGEAEDEDEEHARRDELAPVVERLVLVRRPADGGCR